MVEDLLDEWAGPGLVDASRWVPYRWNLALELRDFEILLILNSRNWIDTSSQNEVGLFNQLLLASKIKYSGQNDG